MPATLAATKGMKHRQTEDSTVDEQLTGPNHPNDVAGVTVQPSSASQISSISPWSTVEAAPTSSNASSPSLAAMLFNNLNASLTQSASISCMITPINCALEPISPIFSNTPQTVHGQNHLHHPPYSPTTSGSHSYKLGISHFKQLFKAPQGTSLVEIISIAGHFPGFVDPDGMEDLIKPVTMGELESTLKWFKKDKSPGPDGWPVEFYLAFLDIVGPDLLGVVEESRILDRIYAPINSTFIALIPKSDSLLSYNDFHPIPLYNCLYKIIAKIIANHINPILS